ncbi:carbohydrate-binding protein [Flavobacterium sp. MC2016-06]|jgi:hypothetical protein|uniref:carbohydrate-binding protein n=1 Tax=Flavobacterium sp. MC2016-06 TaxID=2676308 RepID=UPI0012BA8727|nr:carbohydrate-binding protein [Flavobacterium sp. MC2016-06]MBU3858919.1 carbohydrate-binding protein [Flavobacterium sp. MC2016-06]
MKTWKTIICGIAIISLASFIKPVQIGKPWQGKPQQIPGKVECELYDEGGEGAAYHDTDAENNGSGKLNPVNGNPLNEFRIKDGADISYTKDGDIDNNPFNKTSRSIGQLYLGWTQPAEWVNYTVEVTKSGTYKIGALYTSNGNGEISIDVNGKDATGIIKIESTHDDRDTIAWRQWHHWNKSDFLGNIKLKKGKQLLTVRIITNGNMNLDYLTFSSN